VSVKSFMAETYPFSRGFIRHITLG